MCTTTCPQLQSCCSSEVLQLALTNCPLAHPGWVAWSAPEAKTDISVSWCCKLFALRYLPQSFPAPLEISALHLPRTCTSREAMIKNCSKSCASNWFYCRSRKWIPLCKGSEEGSGKSSPENLVLRVSLHILMISSEVLPSTPTSKPEKTALLCFCLAPLSEQ